MQDKQLNIALIGTGMVAKTHLLAIADLKGKVHLSGVFSRSSANAEKFAKDAQELLGKEIKQYQSVEEIADDPEVDFVILLTPPNARIEITKTLAEKGKAILMEKPIERTLQAAEQIVEICQSANVKLGIVFQHRTRAASQKLADLMRANTFGKLCIVDVCVPWWREQAYYDEPGRGTYARDRGGVLISQAIHSLDLMLSLTGDVTQVQAMARTSALHKMESEDYVSAGLEFSNGAIGSLLATTANFPGDTEAIVLHFEKAVAELKTGELKISWHDGKTEHFGNETTSGGGADPMAFTHEWHQAIIEDFADSLLQNKDPLVTGKEGLKVHKLIDALVRSSAQKCAIKL